MPPTFTYPGVYIEEIPSGVHTITGVATSIAAFVGWAAEGPPTRRRSCKAGPTSEPVRRAGRAQSAGILRQPFLRQRRPTGIHHPPRRARRVAPWQHRRPRLWRRHRLYCQRLRSLPVVDQLRRADRYQPLGRDALLAVRRLHAERNPGDGDRELHEPVDAGQRSASARRRERHQRSAHRVAAHSAHRRLGHAGCTSRRRTRSRHRGCRPRLTCWWGRRWDGAESGASIPHRAQCQRRRQQRRPPARYRADLQAACVPGRTDPTTIQSLHPYCRDERAFYIVDSKDSDNFTSLQTGPIGITGADSINSAFYFPWVNAPDRFSKVASNLIRRAASSPGSRPRPTRRVVSGKRPPASTPAYSGEAGLTTVLTDLQNGTLNINAVNCLRTLPVYGNVVWGARTMDGDDQRGSEWKYVPVRRMALFLEESLFRGTQWVVFEPNDEPLWAQIRLNIGAFLQTLFRQGAFQGRTPREAYLVKCDRETTTQADINRGVVNILRRVRAAQTGGVRDPRIQQIAGELQT